MENKIIVITGVNSGLGKVAAISLAREGVKVVMICRNKEKGELVRQKIVRNIQISDDTFCSIYKDPG